MNEMRDELYKIKLTDVKYLEDISPSITINVSSEFGTAVDLILPTNQIVRIWAVPDYNKNLRVYVCI